MSNRVRHVAQEYRKVEVLAEMTFEPFVQSRALVNLQHHLAKIDHRLLFDEDLRQFRLDYHLVQSTSSQSELMHLE